MPISTADFLDGLRKFQLLEAAKVDDIARQTKGKNVEPRVVAQKLIERKLLTPYQVNELLQGKGQQLLLGSYVLLERLGEGGMGEVFIARHTKMGRVVAVKLIRKERLANENAVKRFHREIRAAAQLTHPNIVHAFDADQVGSTHLFVMEYVEGVDLAKLVKDKGPLPVDAACDYMHQTACGLAHAHEKGLVHRDIKPQNLLLSKAGVVKILDMGLARMQADEDSSTLTQEGSVMGTLDYLAPEQAMNSHTVDIRADLYSLGCTFYFLLTGRVPFPGGTAAQKMYQHQFGEPDPVVKLRPDVPPWVAAVVRKLLAKKPEDRFQTPAELATALARSVHAQPVAAQKRRFLGPVLAGVALLGLGLFGLFGELFSPSKDGAPPPTPPDDKPTRVMSYQGSFQGPTPAPGWQYLWNEKGPIGNPANYGPLLWDGEVYNADGKPGLPRPGPGAYVNLNKSGGVPGHGTGQKSKKAGLAGFDLYAIAASTIQVSDGSGIYGITASSMKLVHPEKNGNGIELLIHVNAQEPLRRELVPAATDPPINFDTKLRTLRPGDTIYVAVGPASYGRGRRTAIRRGAVAGLIRIAKKVK